MQKLTDFHLIRPNELLSEVKKVIADNRKAIDEVVARYQDGSTPLDWDGTMQLLDDRDESLMERLFYPVAHLKSVAETDEIRETYNQAQPLITAYQTELGQNRRLFDILARLRGQAKTKLNEAQAQQLDNYLHDCRLTGVDLPDEQREEYRNKAQRLAQLCTKFSENLLDATQAWTKLIKDERQLAGVPGGDKEQLRYQARAKGKKGYLLGLHLPCYLAIIRYADDESLRREIYTAYSTRASELGPQAGQYDNSSLMAEILSLRYRLAELLGYKNSAALLMARNMVREPAEIKDFLLDLAARARPQAQREAAELTDFVGQHKKEFHPWDVGYYSEQLRQKKHHFSAEELRSYFVARPVFENMFNLAKRLFEVDFVRVSEFDSWHKDVELFAMKRSGSTLGYIYCDLYARDFKRGGAWMNENRQRRRLSDGSLQLPVAYLVCNFRRPLDGGEALLLHEEVVTLFHEFGHCLHHLLTRVECRGVAGINGVPHDMIELPSQLMENWCWEEDFLTRIGCHYKSGQPLPASLLRNLVAARNFQSGLMTLRQIEFALFDIRLHSEFSATTITPRLAQQLYDEVREEWSLLPQADFNRFPNSFSHIFAGGYAAGYYAYKWAEVMADDIYAAFAQRGIYDGELAKKLRRHIFERGGVGSAMDNFVAVLGRKPDMTAFLRHKGIA